MRTFIVTITVFVVLNLAMAGFGLATNAPEKEGREEGTKEVMEATQKEVEKVIKEAEAAATQRGEILQQFRRDMGLERAKALLGIGMGKILVIPGKHIEEDLVAVYQIMEDMNVMCRIFDKELVQAHLVPVRGGFLGGDYWGGGGNVFSQFLDDFGWDSHATEGIYLHGYGSLFLIKVDFPLLPPPEIEEQKSKEDVDPIWQQTKREIYAPEDLKREPPAEKYDAEKVKNLKRTLIKALKHAANIRSLKPDEWVVITIRGSQAGIVVKTHAPVSKPTPAASITISKAAKTGFPSPAVYIIRAKKSDIDAFSKVELDFDKFRQKVQILAY